VPEVPKSGPGSSPTSNTASHPKLAWTASKSPLSFQVRRFIARSGHEVAILIDHGRGPALYPTVFMTCCYDKSGTSANTREMVLRAIGMARAWAEARDRDLDHDLRRGQFLSHNDVEALADHLMLSVEAQAAANIAASSVRRSPRRTSKLEQLRPNPKALSKLDAGIKPGSGFPRINWVAKYVEWHLQQRIGAADRSRDERDELRNLGPQVLARLRERGRGDGRRAMDNEALEGVPQEVIDLVSDALRPGDPRNPFTPGFVQERNELLWHFFISTGGRRGEVQSVLVEDVQYSTRRLYISQSKTQTRTVSISRAAAEKFDQFIQNHWSKLPQQARRRGFLFTSESGEPLSVRSINRIFVTIRTRVPGCPKFLVPHTTRRSWNDRFSELVDNAPPEKRMSAEREMRTRNALQGWSPDSSMGALYANRHIRKKADELGEELANTIAKDRSIDVNT
jgi:integrase